MIDHVAYTVAPLPEEEWEDVALALDRFFALLGFVRMPVKDDNIVIDEYEQRHRQRWYTDGDECDVHIVCKESIYWGWQHFCIKVEPAKFKECRDSQYMFRDSGSGRIWLYGPGGIRVEVRPYGS